MEYTREYESIGLTLDPVRYYYYSYYYCYHQQCQSHSYGYSYSCCYTFDYSASFVALPTVFQSMCISIIRAALDVGRLDEVMDYLLKVYFLVFALSLSAGLSHCDGSYRT
jgi:hypothetical protein